MLATYQTQNTKIAAALGALQFPIQTDVAFDASSGKTLTTFTIGLRSADGRYADCHKLVKDYENGELEKADPWHPFLCGLRCEHNYTMLQDAQHQGRRIRLVPVAGGFAAAYRDGDELPQFVFAKETIQLADLSLAAALGTLGIPVIRITGSKGSRMYTLPRYGHELTIHPSSEVRKWDAHVLAQRATPGQLELRLELDEPSHPVVAAYNCRHVYNQLRRHLGQTGKLVLIRDPQTMRAAYVSENASGRVLDRVQRHMRVQ